MWRLDFRGSLLTADRGITITLGFDYKRHNGINRRFIPLWRFRPYVMLWRKKEHENQGNWKEVDVDEGDHSSIASINLIQLKVGIRCSVNRRFLFKDNMRLFQKRRSKYYCIDCSFLWKNDSSMNAPFLAPEVDRRDWHLHNKERSK